MWDSHACTSFNQVTGCLHALQTACNTEGNQLHTSQRALAGSPLCLKANDSNPGHRSGLTDWCPRGPRRHPKTPCPSLPAVKQPNSKTQSKSSVSGVWSHWGDVSTGGRGALATVQLWLRVEIEQLHSPRVVEGQGFPSCSDVRGRCLLWLRLQQETATQVTPGSKAIAGHAGILEVTAAGLINWGAMQTFIQMLAPELSNSLTMTDVVKISSTSASWGEGNTYTQSISTSGAVIPPVEMKCLYVPLKR